MVSNNQLGVLCLDFYVVRHLEDLNNVFIDVLFQSIEYVVDCPYFKVLFILSEIC